jgi:hypothetical protein
MIRTLLLSKPYLAVELFILGALIPTLVLWFRLAPYMFVFLWSAALYCALIYRAYYHKKGEPLWRFDALNWPQLRPIIARWLAASLLLMGLTALAFPEKLFSLFYTKPEIIPVLLFAYPIVSALPQEFIFCTYFFRRYAPLWQGNERITIWVSAVTFAYVHVLFSNWVAPPLSLIAGYIFATTYARTRSLSLVTFEHGLYGNSIFLIGLGWFFWGGSIQH